MDIYLAGRGFTLDDLVDDPEFKLPQRLHSYYYMRDNPDERDESLNRSETFMLDSGAFTFLTNRKTIEDFDTFLDGYIEFINRYSDSIDYFLELDVDSVAGHAQVREYRDRLERETGRESIPVWHPNRGKQAFLDLADEYDYIALGGIYDEISPKWFEYFPWFIERAHERGTKIHALGFTPTKNMSRYPFDSVDSRSWLSGGLNGTVYHFNGTGLESHTRDRRRKHYLKLHRHNLQEWLKYDRYMDDRGGLEAYQSKRCSDPNSATGGI